MQFRGSSTDNRREVRSDAGKIWQTLYFKLTRHFELMDEDISTAQDR